MLLKKMIKKFFLLAVFFKFKNSTSYSSSGNLPNKGKAFTELRR